VAQNLRGFRLDVSDGSVVQVYSTGMRQTVSTFLMNTSRVHTVFRALLEGPDGGFQGPMDAIVLAGMDNGSCSAALAVLPNRNWYVHSLKRHGLKKAVDNIPREFKPLRLHGEPESVRYAIENSRLKSMKVKKTAEFLFYEMPMRMAPRPSVGQQRLARPTDLARLDEYVAEFGKEVSGEPHEQWREFMDENRIMLGIVEGTIASVAIRGALTIDRVQLEGVFTFKPFRRRGLARSLVAVLSRQASGNGRMAVSIVPSDNVPMISLLDSLGFNKTSDYVIVEY
jgi:GNAT superfamily N-acetyltransferase